MGLGRYMVDAVVLEGRSPTELARTHGISRSWINELVARFRLGGYPALEPASRRPRSCPHQVGPLRSRPLFLSCATNSLPPVTTPAPRPSLTTWSAESIQRLRWPPSGGFSAAMA